MRASLFHDITFVVMKKWLTGVVLLLGIQVTSAQTSSEILLKMLQFQQAGKVLYLAAHPDDENTQLLSYLVNNRKYETAYLSVTRGDGGQNLIGTEQGDVLGLIRTHELLAARKVDGAQQFFTRAKDFGFSKSAKEVFQLWPDSIVLYDVVKVIRQFQPDIIITRFPDDERAGHGQHEASAILAKKAFAMAADANAFADQLADGLQPWQTKRIFWNTFRFGGMNTTAPDQLKVQVGQFLPLLGKNDGQLAAESRSQHKSQGFGVAASHALSDEFFVQWGGSPAVKDLMEGVANEWLSEVEQNAWKNILQKYAVDKPYESLYRLLEFKNELDKNKKLAQYPAKNKLLNDIILAVSGLKMDAFIQQPFVFKGDSLTGTIRVFSTREDVVMHTLRLNNTQLYKLDIYDTISVQKSIVKNSNIVPFSYKITESEQNSIEYWMQATSTAYLFSFDQHRFKGTPVNPPIFNVTVGLVLAGYPIEFNMPVEYKVVDPIDGELYHPVKILPYIKVKTVQNIVLKKEDPVAVQIEALKSFEYDSILVEWSGSNNEKYYTKQGKGTFQVGQKLLVTPAKFVFPAKATRLTPLVYLYRNNSIDTISGSTEWKSYKHIPTIFWKENIDINIHPAPVRIAKSNIAYIAGAGDKVAEYLSMIGFHVSHLTPDEVSLAALKKYDAVIFGVRALNVYPALAAKEADFMQYVQEGGNVIVQYNTNNQLGKLGSFGPYPYQISRNRVVDESSPVKINNATHSALNFPNKIDLSDFNGWVQERGLYFADQIDNRYQTPLSFQDAGEPFNNGSLIIAKHGKGNFVYTGIAFFRQLPAGVMGAYKLFANLIAL